MSVRHEIRIDRTKALSQDPATGHNRWHPDISPVRTVELGDTVCMETRDALDGMVTSRTEAADLATVEFGRIHPLTGPLYVKGAEPGDVLAVRIMEVRPEAFGFTLLMPGFGILREYFPDPFIAKWEIAGGIARSPQIPGVRIPGAPFMGVMGVAPSHDLLQRAEERESELLQRGGFVLPASREGAVPSDSLVATKGLRTVPPRENGGNVDIRHLTAGTTVYFPVFVTGALFSAGDAHFAQGDCESCGTAIEMGASLVVQFSVIKKPPSTYLRGLHYSNTGHQHPTIAAAGAYYATTGIPITADGRNESEDVTLAARNALLAMIDHLVLQYGFARQQAYALTSVSVDLHISELVDVPNVLVSAFLPLDIFEQQH